MRDGAIEVGLSAGDREQLAGHGLDPEQVARQLALLRRPPPPPRLLRPCTAGDGIIRLDEREHATLVERHGRAAADGRLAKLVPASGAASRMFQELIAVYRGEDAADGRETVARVRERLADLPFHPELRKRGEPLADEKALLHALLAADGLDLARRPKGLLPFHRDPGEPRGYRTAFEEHLVEGAAYLRDDDGRCRYGFTVTPRHEDDFRALLERDPNGLATRLGARFEVVFSSQSPATDVVATTPSGELFRRDDGRLLLRPGGHGSLLGNLRATAGDVVYLKTIDNVLPADRQERVVRWQKLLAGKLLELEERIFDLLRRLDAGDGGVRDEAWLDDALGFVAATFGAGVGGLRAAPAAERAAWLRHRLERPLRLCGMVRNTGEPGGGPFWVDDAELGPSPQIVELSQIDRDDPEKREMLARATHFNPVALVCALRDRHGRPWDLERFVDPDAVFIAEKSFAGRPLLALEHPGLWNGAMARWNTVFVEVPADTFAPVKTVLDLLRPEHQPVT